MKARESGMPNEEMWSTFFNPEEALAALGLTSQCRDVVEFGCGYGTFTIPAARIVKGKVYALDIEPDMVAITAAKAAEAGLTNVVTRQRDFITEGSGLPSASVDYAMLFNILHVEDPKALLREAFSVLSPCGLLGIMHWNYDPSTPRGPSMDIRPKPEDCRRWAEEVGFQLSGKERIDLPPFHYGLTMIRYG